VLQTALKALFGSRNDRLLKTYRKRVEQINALEPEFQKLTDEQLQAKTPELKKRVAELERANEILKTSAAFFARAELDRRLK